MNELKLSGGRIRVQRRSIQLTHSLKRHPLEDISILFKDIHHVELYKPRWPFSNGYIRFSLDGSHHAKKDTRAAEQESFSMRCHSMQEYKKLARIKRFVETEMEMIQVGESKKKGRLKKDGFTRRHQTSPGISPSEVGLFSSKG